MAQKNSVEKNVSSKKSTTRKTTSKKSAESEILICNTAHLAKMYGISERQIYNQIEKGIAVKVGANKFDCVQSVSNYINQMREQEKAQEKTPKNIKVATEATKLKHEQFKSRKTELQVLQMEGKLHYEEDVKALWNDSVSAVKSKLAAIGVKLAPQLKGEIDEALIQEYIDREIYEALNELSSYNAESFEKDYTTFDIDTKDGDGNDD